jgi:hypothetical protein
MNSKEIVKELLAAKDLAELSTGVEVKMHSQECRIYKSTHENCLGCLSISACVKMAGLLLATLSRDPAAKMQEVLDRDSMGDVDFDFNEEGYQL